VAAAGIRAAPGNPAVDAFATDMSAQAGVRRLAAQVLDTYPRLDVLVNNVGGFWAHRHVTTDGLERTFALNHTAAVPPGGQTPDHRVRGGPQVRAALRRPVAYTRHNGALLVGTQFAWARNLCTGEPVHIRLAGKRQSADVQVVADETGVVEHFASMARDNHQFAKFNKIGLAQRGDPRPTTFKSRGPRAPGSPY
jgi:NAD(P)-dependent dehydrogenase (short-subunit alcohol dehydrogenase family)